MLIGIVLHYGGALRHEFFEIRSVAGGDFSLETAT